MKKKNWFEKLMVCLLCVCVLMSLFACTNSAETKPTVDADAGNSEQAETDDQQETQDSQSPSSTEIPEEDKIVMGSASDVVPNRKYKIAYANFNDENPVAVEVRDGFVAAAEEYGVELWVMDNQLDPVVANANADMAIAAGDVDFYIQYNQNMEINSVIGEKFLEAGIPAVAVQVQMITGDGYEFPFYGMDNYATGVLAGQMLGQAAMEKWGADADITFFCLGYPESGALFQERAQGATDGVLESYPDIRVVDESTTGNPDVARQRTADFLTANPEGKIIIWTHADEITPSVLAAIDASGRREDVLVASGAMTMSMLDMIRADDTIMVGTIDLMLGDWGWDLLPRIITALNEGESLPQKMITPFDIVTPENVDEKYPAA